MANKRSPSTIVLSPDTVAAARAQRGASETSTTSTPDTSTAAAHSPAPRDDDGASLRKPDWPKGLTLMAQHFEAQDAYHERRTTFVLGLLYDQPWGIGELTLNVDAIQAGEIAVTRFAGIFPDGTPVALGGTDGSSALARSFESALRTRDSADVYLGLLRETSGRPMIDGTDGTTDVRRFARRSATRAELGTGQNPASVPWLRPNVRILFEGEAIEEYTVLRIARLTRARPAGVTLQSKFVPPVLRVRTSPSLSKLLQELEQRVQETRTALAASRREGQDTTRFQAARTVLLMMLGRAAPRIADLLATNVHPRDAYGVLAEIAGALAPFGAEGGVTIPRFDFLELGATFDALASQIHQVTASITASRYRPVPLSRHDEFLRWADLREPGIFGKQFILAIRAGDPSRLRLEIPMVAKVGSSERIGALISAALPGVALVAEPHRPAGLDLPPQSVCFRLEQQGDHWEEVMRRGTLSIYLPQPYQNGDVSLFVKERGVLE